MTGAVAGANNGVLEKISTGDFSGDGLLNSEEFADFFMAVREQSTVLNRARAVPVDSPTGDIPILGVGSRVMQGVSEGSAGTKQTVNQPSRSYQTTKVSIPWELTWEAVNETIGNPEEKIRQAFTQQFAADLEILGSVGDESLSGFEAINDGWLTLAQASGSLAGTHDHMDGGSTSQPVNNELFEAMLGLMPPKFKEQRTLVFLMSHAQKEAYQKFLVNDRQTAAGDAALLNGDDPTPYGHEIVTPLGWSDNTVMLTSMDNLAYVIQSNVRVKSTQSSERNVMNDIESIMNLLAKIDYQIMEPGGVALGINVAAPTP